MTREHADQPAPGASKRGERARPSPPPRQAPRPPLAPALALALFTSLALSGCGALDSLALFEDSGAARETLSNFTGSWHDDSGRITVAPTSRPARKVQPSLVPAREVEPAPDCTQSMQNIQSIQRWFEARG